MQTAMNAANRIRLAATHRGHLQRDISSASLIRRLIYNNSSGLTLKTPKSSLLFRVAPSILYHLDMGAFARALKKADSPRRLPDDGTVI
jgi:hypothetical protein